ncbi:hypothetical protein [Ralstonia syzygii]|nr:hypothetical protein [Ralstonia syzygii]
MSDVVARDIHAAGHGAAAPSRRPAAGTLMVAAIPHADVPLPFKDGAWMLYMAAVLIFMVGAIDSLFLFFYTRRKP